jgi:hypothetical protein
MPWQMLPPPLAVPQVVPRLTLERLLALQAAVQQAALLAAAAATTMRLFCWGWR